MTASRRTGSGQPPRAGRRVRSPALRSPNLTRGRGTLQNARSRKRRATEPEGRQVMTQLESGRPHQGGGACPTSPNARRGRASRHAQPLAPMSAQKVRSDCGGACPTPHGDAETTPGTLRPSRPSHPSRPPAPARLAASEARESLARASLACFKPFALKADAGEMRPLRAISGPAGQIPAPAVTPPRAVNAAPALAARAARASRKQPARLAPLPLPTATPPAPSPRGAVRRSLAELRGALGEGWEIVQPIFARPLWSTPDNSATGFHFVLRRECDTRLITVPAGRTVQRFITERDLSVNFG